MDDAANSIQDSKIQDSKYFIVHLKHHIAL